MKELNERFKRRGSKHRWIVLSDDQFDKKCLSIGEKKSLDENKVNHSG